MSIFKNKIFLKRALTIFSSVLLVFILFYFSIYIGLWGKVPTTTELRNLKQSQATQVLDKDGRLIGKFYDFDRQSIKRENLPQYLVDALIATEDNRFYQHDGVDKMSLLRVFFKTILMGDKSSGGGSTITLQLAKNLFGRKNHGVFSMPVNKIRESIVASRIEDLYSKDEILVLYFNTVPFSDNTFGIESASRKFFNTTTQQLTLSQAATLVGSLKASHTYNPRLFPERSQLRRDVVLQQMVKYGYLSEADAQNTMDKKLELNYQFFSENQGPAPYFREQVRRELTSFLENYTKEDGSAYDVNKDGLKVYTTLDYDMQLLAETSMREHMAKLQATFEKSYGKNAPWLKNKQILQDALIKLPAYNNLKNAGIPEKNILDSLSVVEEKEVFSWEGNQTEKMSSVDSLKYYLKFLNAGLISVEPSTGAVRAYIGGIDYRYFKFDHVTQSKRQAGSTFKPFVYTAAIENGMDPCTYFPVRQVTYTNAENWTPQNATKEEGEEDPYLNYSLKTALSRSVNTIAVKVLNEVGISAVIDQTHKMGITSELPAVPSLALGTAEVSLYEMAGAYASFANHGIPVKPYFITRIEDKEGKLIAEFERPAQQQAAYSERTREIMLEMLKATVNEGTAQRLRSQYGLQNDIAGKTGTTQDNRDGWFAGITPNMVTLTWVGNDDPRIRFKSTSLGQGANTALPIFALMLQKMNKKSVFNAITRASFEIPDDDVLIAMNCAPEKQENFFERLFGNHDKEVKFGEKKKKRGFFSFLKRKKDTIQE